MPTREQFAEYIDYPVFGPDPRQGIFHSVIRDHVRPLLADQGMEEASIINTTYGWLASHVNIGWIKDNAKLLHEKGLILTKRDLQDFLFSSVQRGKSIQLKDGWADVKTGKREPFDSEKPYVSVEFVTKDDSGYMEYRFHISGMDLEFPEAEE